MKINDEFIEQFAGTSCYERLKNTQRFYDYIDIALDSFTSRENIHCPSGCGSCCENYNPELSVSEAEFIACYLLQENRVDEFHERIKHAEENGIDHCPMYNGDCAYHCSIYPARGLVCRLFGSACSKDTSGAVHDPACRWSDDISGDIILDGYPNPPIGTNFGIELEMINGTEQDIEPLYKAVEKAIIKLQMILNFCHDWAQ